MRPLAEVIHLADVILEQNDYHVFGGRIDSQSLPTWSSNRYRFNGKEQLATATADLGFTDYGARMYSSRLSRWTTPDPLADKYHSTSPYTFSGNNPVNYVDPDGRFIGTTLDIISVVSGVKNLAQNIKAGNVKDAVIDGVGVVVDMAAVLMPVVPGGVGTARHLIKAGDASADLVTDAIKATSKVSDANKGAKTYITYTKKIPRRAKSIPVERVDTEQPKKF